LYERARLGAYVFHDSLLPRYRGFSPTVWAMINGESETGATLFAVSEEVDYGDIIAQSRVSINSDETIAEVMERVTDAYLLLLEQNLPRLMSGNVPRTPQDHLRATYTSKRVPEDNRIMWNSPTDVIHNLIRAVTRPYTGAYTYLDDMKLIVWSAVK